MARRTLQRDIRTEMLNYMRRQGSLPSTARGFYKSCEDATVTVDGKTYPIIDFWVKQWAHDSIWKSVKGVWRAKPRDKGSGLRLIPGAKKPLPEILILPKFEDGFHRKILTTFALMRHVQLNLDTREDNFAMIAAALKETRDMTALAWKAAGNNANARVTSFTIETIDEAGDDEADDEEEDGDEE